MPLYIPAIANLTGDVTSVGNTTSYANTVPVAKGGTGQTTIQTALAALSTWTTSISYAVGQQVTYGTSIYICIVAHTSGASIAADIALGKWVFDGAISHTAPNLMLTGNNFEDNTVGGWVAVGTPTVTNGLPVSVGSGGNVFSTSNGGQAKGSNTTAAAVTASSPIDGIYSLNLATSGVGTIGDGYISQSIPISTAYQAKALTLKFKYKSASGAPVMTGTSSNTYAAAVYDVTNNAWLGFAGAFNFIQTSGVGDFVGTFQTASTTAAIQVFIYSPVAPVGASSLLLDGFYLGQQATPMGPAITDWVAYTPTFTGFGTPSAVSFFSRRVADTLEVVGKFTAGTTTTTPGLISLGYNGANANVSVDTAKVAASTTLGVAWAGAAATTTMGWSILAPATNLTTVILGFQSSTVLATTVSTNASTAVTSSAVVEVNFKAPIVGWSSNTSQSNDTDTRVVAFRASNTAGTSINNNGSDITVPFVTVDYDTHGAWNGTDTYTVPVTGKYKIAGTVNYASSTWALNNIAYMTIYKNGSIASYGATVTMSGAPTAVVGTNVTTTLNLVAGDTIICKATNTRTAGATSLNSVAAINTLDIQRVSGPAVIAATESVNARYHGSSTTISGANATIVYSTKDFDSHNAYSAGTYTIPVSGKYQVNAAVFATWGTGVLNDASQISLFKNGTIFALFDVTNAAGQTQNSTLVSDIVSCNAGDTIVVQYLCQNTTPVISSGNSGAGSYFSIARVGN